MPGKKALEKKQAAVASIAEKLKKASAGVFVDYKGINVAEDTSLRAELRKAGVEYSVVKNTLTGIAARGLGYDFDDVLKGTTALAVSATDPVAPARILYEYSKKNDKYKIKAGFVEGRRINAGEVAELAQLPPREVLVAKVLGGFNAPIAGFIGVLNANIRGLVVALNAIAEKKAQ